MKNFVFLAHWSLAFVEEQFYALFRNFQKSCTHNCIYFSEWNNSVAVNYLLHKLFHASDQATKTDFSNYPDMNRNSDQQHSLIHCAVEDTIFIVYFSPRHLEFFLQSSGNRFPQRYIWWQIEQATNTSFFNNRKYVACIQNSLAILEFSRANTVPNLHSHCLFAPFSRDANDLKYSSNCARAETICNHQKQRLLQDNPHFASVVKQKFQPRSVLLLGTCEKERRKTFVQLCNQINVTVLHPHRFNYYYGLERQEYIKEFINNCAHLLSVAINIHQYENSVLEQAKIYLLLANGIDVVVSERSTSEFENAQIKAACGQRVVFVNSLQEAAEIAAKMCCEKRLSAKTELRNSQCFENLYLKLLQNIATLV